MKDHWACEPEKKINAVTSALVLFSLMGCSQTVEVDPQDTVVVQLVFDAEQDRATSSDAGPDADALIKVADAEADTPDAQSVPTPPAALTRWMTGNDADAAVVPSGPGFILMGGGGEPDAAFDWWVPLLNGGDVVVLRVSGSDGYNDYLYSDIGGVDSVETLKVDSVALANDPYVAWRIDHAEGVFIAGGNQWDYISLWSDTELQKALQRINDRGAVLGGTSAGLAVLGDRAFSAKNNTVYSDEALANPYHASMQFEDEFLTLSVLDGIVTDSHFAERDRMGRLVAFVARMWKEGFDNPHGFGIDESTALLIGPAGRKVVGSGAVYDLYSNSGPAVCEPGQPLNWPRIVVTKTTATDLKEYEIDVIDGAIPQAPY